MNANYEEVLNRYRSRMVHLDAHLYTQTFEEDILLLKWWMLLVETGDIDKLIVPENRRLALFLAVFQPPTITFYALDVHGRIDFVGWFKDPSPADKTIFCGSWTRSDLRGSKRQLKLAYLMYSLVFEFYDNILGATWQPELLKLHTKFGYNIVGNIPNFMGQPVVFLVHLAKADFLKSRFAIAGSKL